MPFRSNQSRCGCRGRCAADARIFHGGRIFVRAKYHRRRLPPLPINICAPLVVRRRHLDAYQVKRLSVSLLIDACMRQCIELRLRLAHSHIFFCALVSTAKRLTETSHDRLSSSCARATRREHLTLPSGVGSHAHHEHAGDT